MFAGEISRKNKWEQGLGLRVQAYACDDANNYEKGFGLEI